MFTRCGPLSGSTPRPKAVLWAPEQSPFAAHEWIVLDKTSLLLAIQALSVRKLVKGELSSAALRALGATPREVRTLFAWANQQACGIV